jgi:hypothetical protein
MKATDKVRHYNDSIVCLSPDAFIRALVAGKLPVIIGAAPLANSKIPAARQLFANGHHDRGPQPQMTTMIRARGDN